MVVWSWGLDGNGWSVKADGVGVVDEVYHNEYDYACQLLLQKLLL